MLSFMAKLRERHEGLAVNASHRLAGQGGFTLIELLVVLVIIGILLAIAVPSYLGFKTRANKTAAQGNVRSALPAVEAYYSDHATYVGATPANLALSYDTGIKISGLTNLGAATYCIAATSGSFTYYKNGPAAGIVQTKPAAC